MKKQTSIEWLHEIAKKREPDKFDWEYAKKMHKEEIEKAFDEGYKLRDDVHDFVNKKHS